MAREYNFVVIQFKGKHRPILCHRSEKCSALVAIANMSFLQEGEVNPKNPPPHVDPQVLTESIVGELKEVISGLQRETTLYDQAKGKEKILEKIAGSLDSPVTLDPVNNSCFEFNQTDELLVMTILDVPILHGWVLDKKDTHLDFVKGVSRSNFRTKLAEAEQRNSSDALRKELNDFMNARITTYGLACLHEAIGEGGLAILYDNNGYHVVCKDGGDLFTLETNEEVVTQLPNAVWKKLSIEENKSFHVTSSFTPTHGQPKEKQELKMLLLHNIVFVELMVARQLENHITDAIRTVVLEYGVDGMFSSAWDHFECSNCNMMPLQLTQNEIISISAETIAQDTELEVKLLIRVCTVKPDLAYFEVSVSSPDLSSKVVNPKLLDFKQFLEKEDILVEHSIADLLPEDDCIVISKVIKAEERKIVAHGPFCKEWNIVLSHLLSWLSAVTE